jgi:mono/diheme cytochrome c family protein
VLLVAAVALIPAAAAAQDVHKGQELFAANRCTLCHSVAGKGNPKGALDDVGSKYGAADLREWLVNAKAMSARHHATRKPPMKDFSTLAKSDVEALVAYLQTLKK